MSRFLSAAVTLSLFALVACSGGRDGQDDGEAELRGRTCGGIAGILCPSGQTCKLSGNHPDASGTCVRAQQEVTFCGGIGGISCPSGKHCVLSGNFPDASGHCEQNLPGEEGTMCGGLAAIRCHSGLRCEIHAQPNQSDPAGTCVVAHGNNDDDAEMCGGFAGLQCPAGKHCVDRPNDGCSPSNGGADCPGMCVAN